MFNCWSPAFDVTTLESFKHCNFVQLDHFVRFSSNVSMRKCLDFLRPSMFKFMFVIPHKTSEHDFTFGQTWTHWQYSRKTSLKGCLLRLHFSWRQFLKTRPRKSGNNSLSNYSNKMWQKSYGILRQNCTIKSVKIVQ